MKNFDKEIWKLFKVNRDDFNRCSVKIEKVLSSVFEQGRKQGKSEQRKEIISDIKKLK